MAPARMPVLFAEGETLPEAWERSVLLTWQQGALMPTEYDHPGDPPSRDCSMVMVIADPFAEPRLHRALPGGLAELETYRQEVVDGIHDHWIAPEEGKWSYTYHQRLFQFEADARVIDQIDFVIRKLSATGHSRRAQAITWNPAVDPPTEHPPCLQRLWFRLVPQPESPISYLEMHAHWRSRDAFKAAFMNIFALTDLQRAVGERIAAATGRDIRVGAYVDFTDSYHIYGSYYGDLQRFLETVEKRSWEERTWPSAFAEPMFEDARERLREESGKAG